MCRRVIPGPLSRLVLSGVILATCSQFAIAANNIVEYTFDNAGNITAIDRQVTSGFAITSFSPTSGAVGTAVTLYGTGFSATPASNAVKFNGVTASVSASASGSISTTVPASAITGRITVTVGGNTVTSTQDFTVIVPGAPTVTSFTPGSGLAAATVSVTGAGFNAAAGATTVMLNGVSASSTASSATALTFTVPAAAASGRITATTAAGTGTSVTDFIVPPAGVNAADIVTSVRIAVGGANVNVAMGEANKSAIVLFDAAANGWYSVQFSTFETSPTNPVVAYKVMNPDNTVLASGNVGYGLVPSIHLPKLATSGTYSILLSPGTATLNTNIRVVANPALTIDGASAATSMDFAYQSFRFIFDATANQRIGIGALGVTLTPSAGAVFLALYKADGTWLGSRACTPSTIYNPQGNCDYELAAPVTGTYALVAENAAGVYSNESVQLSSYVTGTLTPDVAQVVTLARVGQDAQYAFTASAGDSVGLDIAAAAQLPQAQSISITVIKPDGSTLTTCPGTPPANFYCELGTLATAGTYTLLVDPDYGAYGSFTLTVKQGVLLTTAGAPTAFAPAGVPESVRTRFSATAGQTLSLGVASLAYVGSGGGVSYLSVFLPNGALLNYVSCNPATAAGSCELNLPSLPVTGTYSVVIQPPNGVKVTGNVALSTPVAGTLVVGNPSQTIAIARPGQTARYTMSGTAAELLRINWSAVTVSGGSSVAVTVLKPDGSTLSGGSFVTGDTGGFDIASLPTTGTYTVVFDPSTGATMSAPVTLVTR